MTKSIFMGLFFLLFQTSVSAVSSDGIPSHDSKQYGQTLIAEFDIPAEEIFKFNQLIAAKPDSKPSSLEKFATTLTNGDAWLSDVIRMDSKKNPYRMVLTLNGTAISKGDVESLWAVGWRKDDGISHLAPMAGLIKHDLDAGESFVMTAASEPTTFKTDQTVFPAISFTKAQNLIINSVHVQIWSGAASATWMQIFLSIRLFLIILAVIGVGWFFKRK